MIFADVSAYTISLFLHISAVVVGFGATFAESVTFQLAMMLDKRHLPYVHKLGITINRWFASPALLLILLTGIYQVSDADLDFGSFWISATFAIVLILGGLNGAYLIPGEKRLLAQVQRELAEGGDLSEDYLSKSRRMGMVGALAGLLVLVAIFLMVTKPGA